eukprot:TRINITY_DN19934_c0_g1_i1.p1 TRINITY_DN19934_c0_g1~~TRINITY_DN19934_c0_g1_i1.p1  ORF type:complete len:161 (-),score=17.75 TRINITY_DN19934_c0_g1_i1:73-555(-)
MKEEISVINEAEEDQLETTSIGPTLNTIGEIPQKRHLPQIFRQPLKISSDQLQIRSLQKYPELLSSNQELQNFQVKRVCFLPFDPQFFQNAHSRFLTVNEKFVTEGLVIEYFTGIQTSATINYVILQKMLVKGLIHLRKKKPKNSIRFLGEFLLNNSDEL